MAKNYQTFFKKKKAVRRDLSYRIGLLIMLWLCGQSDIGSGIDKLISRIKRKHKNRPTKCFGSKRCNMSD